MWVLISFMLPKTSIWPLSSSSFPQCLLKKNKHTLIHSLRWVRLPATLIYVTVHVCMCVYKTISHDSSLTLSPFILFFTEQDVFVECDEKVSQHAFVRYFVASPILPSRHTSLLSIYRNSKFVSSSPTPAQYGSIEEMNVCDNLGDHLVGNVYIKASTYSLHLEFTCSALCTKMDGCACSSRMRSLQRRQSLAWTTDGTMASQYMLSCLLSPTSERLAVGSTRWGEDEGAGCEWRGRWRERFYDIHVLLVSFLCLYLYTWLFLQGVH